jgi:hypothetical protein
MAKCPSSQLAQEAFLNRQQANNLFIRSISALLMFGGLAGIVPFLLMQASGVGGPHPILLVFALLLFGACACVGFGLWKNQQQYYRWAILLFLLQVPVIDVSRFAYHFYSGAGLFLSFQSELSSRIAFEFELASAFKFETPSGTENIVIGVNLLALAAALYLMKSSAEMRKRVQESVPGDTSQSANISPPEGTIPNPERERL